MKRTLQGASPPLLAIATTLKHAYQKKLPIGRAELATEEKKYSNYKAGAYILVRNHSVLNWETFSEDGC